ncbi:hypothetical protein FHG87_000238 [Trinorchestia longiramus]|nr:hypothetical protein FHG87_000238 [Trinorchestia longiramus]
MSSIRSRAARSSGCRTRSCHREHDFSYGIELLCCHASGAGAPALSCFWSREHLHCRGSAAGSTYTAVVLQQGAPALPWFCSRDHLHCRGSGAGTPALPWFCSREHLHCRGSTAGFTCTQPPGSNTHSNSSYNSNSNSSSSQNSSNRNSNSSDNSSSNNSKNSRSNSSNNSSSNNSSNNSSNSISSSGHTLQCRGVCHHVDIIVMVSLRSAIKSP